MLRISLRGGRLLNTTNNIVITRTPFRISFCGGGSDLESYYEEQIEDEDYTESEDYMRLMRGKG